MKITETKFKDILIIQPDTYYDNRGFFLESFNDQWLSKYLGKNIKFVQDNISYSKKGVLRGLHYQYKKPQGKLLRLISGEIFDVCVDLREESINFGKYFSIRLSSKDYTSLWVPPGYAHGFYVISNSAELMYKTTEFWYPDFEQTIIWNDKNLNINWPIIKEPILSYKDSVGKNFLDCVYFNNR